MPKRRARRRPRVRIIERRAPRTWIWAGFAGGVSLGALTAALIVGGDEPPAANDIDAAQLADALPGLVEGLMDDYLAEEPLGPEAVEYPEDVLPPEEWPYEWPYDYGPVDSGPVDSAPVESAPVDEVPYDDLPLDEVPVSEVVDEAVEVVEPVDETLDVLTETFAAEAGLPVDEAGLPVEEVYAAPVESSVLLSDEEPVESFEVEPYAAPYGRDPFEESTELSYVDSLETVLVYAPGEGTDLRVEGSDAY